MAAPTVRIFRRDVPAPVFWLTVALIIAVVALTIVGIALLGRQTTTNAPSRHAKSTSQDWIEAVCQRGTYQNGEGGNVLTGSTGTATCSGAHSQIVIGTYNSQFRFDNAIAAYAGVGSYATLTDDSGELWVFYSFWFRTEDLSKLTQFGFTVHGK